MARVIEYTAYRGIHGERRIGVTDLRGVGVADEDLPGEDLVWNGTNYFLLNADKLSEHVVKIILAEPGFKELSPKKAEQALEDNPQLNDPALQ